MGRVEKNQRLPLLGQKKNNECRGMTTKQTSATLRVILATPRVDSGKTAEQPLITQGAQRETVQTSNGGALGRLDFYVYAVIA